MGVPVVFDRWPLSGWLGAVFGPRNPGVPAVRRGLGGPRPRPPTSRSISGSRIDPVNKFGGPAKTLPTPRTNVAAGAPGQAGLRLVNPGARALLSRDTR